MKIKVFQAVLIFAAAILAGCDQKPKTVTASKPINLAEEVARAKAENKFVLLEFGSSDSCPPCQAFDKSVFSKPEFQAYEKSNLVFVRVDFPFRVSLPPEATATNTLLSRQFDVIGFPTFVALNQSGNEFWRSPATNDPAPEIDMKLFAPSNFIALLETLKVQAK